MCSRSHTACRGLVKRPAAGSVLRSTSERLLFEQPTTFRKTMVTDPPAQEQALSARALSKALGGRTRPRSAAP